MLTDQIVQAVLTRERRADELLRGMRDCCIKVSHKKGDEHLLACLRALLDVLAPVVKEEARP